MKVFIILAALACSAFANPTRVIGGVNAERDQYPYQVSILSYQLLGPSHICGGSIISNRYILTAGHCMVSKNLLVKAGLLNQSDSKNVQAIRMESYVVHEGFNGGVGPNDIALIRLESELEFNEHVQPINLPTALDKVYSGDVVLTGWGKTTNNFWDTGAETLQTVRLPLLTDEECAAALIEATGTSKPLADYSNICTGPLSGDHSACNGDSGGPLVQDVTVIGIVSWGMVPCASKGYPAVFTEVSHFIDWINANMK